MKQALYIVDAFTHQPFSGNPAAVCLLDRDTDSNWMQAVAAEMNLSETAFLLPVAEGEWSLRWFSPVTEVDLCGHATLAAAHVLWYECGHCGDRLRFQTRSGLLSAGRKDDRISLDFPADVLHGVSMSEQIAEALGVEPLEVYRGREDLMVLIEHAQQLHRLEPEMDKLSQIDVRGIMVTAESDQADYDFISRFFAPSVGIPEDPVTGSAHCTLGPFWGDRLGRSVVTGFQASKRGGVVEVELLGERVTLSGSASTVLKGELYV